MWGGGSLRWFWRDFNGSSGPHNDHVHLEITLQASRELTADYIRAVTAPPDRVIKRVVASGHYSGEGKYPTWDVTNMGRVIPNDGAPDPIDLPEMGINQLGGDVYDAQYTEDGFLVMLAEDGGVFAIPIPEPL